MPRRLYIETSTRLIDRIFQLFIYEKLSSRIFPNRNNKSERACSSQFIIIELENTKFYGRVFKRMRIIRNENDESFRRGDFFLSFCSKKHEKTSSSFWCLPLTDVRWVESGESIDAMRWKWWMVLAANCGEIGEVLWKQRVEKSVEGRLRILIAVMW